MIQTMTSEYHNSYPESAELMQVCGASTTLRRSNRLRSTASRTAPTLSNETTLQGIRTELNLPLRDQNSYELTSLTGPDMHLVVGPPISRMEALNAKPGTQIRIKRTPTGSMEFREITTVPAAGSRGISNTAVPGGISATSEVTITRATHAHGGA